MPVYATPSVAQGTKVSVLCAGKVAAGSDETTAHFAQSLLLMVGVLGGRRALDAVVARDADGAGAPDALDARAAQRAIAETMNL